MKNYYVLSNGRVRRHDNTLVIEKEDGPKRTIPIADVNSLYLYGEVDLNTKLLNFLAQLHIPLHVFNYYGFYSGTYYPREYLNSGFVTVKQAQHYLDPALRITLAREFVRGAAHGITRTLSYYAHRKLAATSHSGVEEEQEPLAPAEPPEMDAEMEAAVDDALHGEGAELSSTEASGSGVVEPVDGRLYSAMASITSIAEKVDTAPDVSYLLGLEGKMREQYHGAWPTILAEGWAFQKRVRRPPDNEVNALISFGNSHLYAVCLGELYRTQLNPTVSWLHEPGSRRYSLALDLSEVFKPLIVDRTIFRLINTGQLETEHFEKSLNGCLLNDAGRLLFLGALEDRLGTTILHRRLGRHVSYRHLIRLDCYKIIRHISGDEPFRAFRAWW